MPGAAPTAQPILIDVQNPDPEVVARAGRLLRAGGVVAHPSDTVYGLAAAARHEGAVMRLRAMKGRGEERPLLCLIDEPGRIDQLVHSVPRYAVEYISKVWPAPLTLIFHARPDTPCRAADGSVALRCPAQPLTRALVREVAGLLASTSANRSGQPPVQSGQEAIALFGPPPAGIDLALEARSAAEPAAGEAASTLVDCREAKPRLVRAGAVPPELLGIRVPGA